MKYDVSICIPGIRTQNWREFYDTLVLSAANKTFEVVFVSPYDLPENMQGCDNVKMIKDYGCPTRCLQKGVIECEGELVTCPSDDGIWVKGALSKAVDQYREVCEHGDVIILKYVEGPGRPSYTKTHAMNAYWTAGFHPALDPLAGINPDFKWGQWLLKTEYYREIGGYDCSYMAQNHSMHDFLYRIQKAGGKVHMSSDDTSKDFVMNQDWDPRAEDYAYIQIASEKDFQRLISHYGAKSDKPRYKVPYDNWTSEPEVWGRFTDQGKQEIKEYKKRLEEQRIQKDNRKANKRAKKLAKQKKRK